MSKAMRCWLHRWSWWDTYQEDGVWVNTKNGIQSRYSEVRQRRHCVKCGYTQDQLVKYGPLAKARDER